MPEVVLQVQVSRAKSFWKHISALRRYPSRSCGLLQRFFSLISIVVMHSWSRDGETLGHHVFVEGFALFSVCGVSGNDDTVVA